MINPFYISAISFLGTILVFSLRWSEYYQELDTELYLFIISNILINVILGFTLRKKLKFVKLSKENKKIPKIILLIFLGYLVNFVYAKEIPLINAMLGIGTYYGEIKMLPTFYPLLMSLNVFSAIYVFYHYLSFKDIKYFRYSLILLLPFLINMGRGVLFMTLIPCILLYFSQSKFKVSIKIAFKVIAIALVSLFIFGYLGNLRTPPSYLQNISPSERILVIGNATDEFRDSIVPYEFFWTYIYIASPIANLNEFMNYEQEDSNIYEFIVYNFFPQSLRKRSMNIDIINPKQHLVIDTFNVSTAYAIPYLQFGLIGIFLYQITYLLLFFILYLMLKKSQYKSIFLSIYSVIALLSLFSNMLVLDVLIIPIILCVILKVTSKIRFV